MATEISKQANWKTFLAFALKVMIAHTVTYFVDETLGCLSALLVH